MKTNKKIIIVALSDWGGKTKEQIANTILSKLQVLDRGNVEEIIDKLYKCDIIPEVAIDQICQLIPEEGVVIAEGEVEFFGTIGARWGVYKIGGQYINEVLRKAKTKGKKGKLIFIEEK